MVSAAYALPKRAVKILLNLVLVAHDALGSRRHIACGAENRDGECEIVIRAVGPRIILDETVKRR
jgi:histidine phosphotransferase ChpT